MFRELVVGAAVAVGLRLDGPIEQRQFQTGSLDGGGSRDAQGHAGEVPGDQDTVVADPTGIEPP